ncbi:hypothetical protein X777_12385, partial [Ooceraea biroi]
DMNVCDNFLWSYLIDKVFSKDPKPRNLDQLRQAITEEFNNIPQKMIAAACRGTAERCNQLIEMEGHSIQIRVVDRR